MNQKPGLLIDCNALRSLQEDRSCILVDTRGEPEYLEAHIPGAINLPSNDLFDMDTAGLDLLPVPEIQNTVRRVGIDQDTHLVLYDDSGLIPSARVFWVLESLGRSSMSLLNGGFPAWVASTGPTEAGRTRSDAVRGNGTPFVPLAEHRAVATRDDVLAATHEPAHLIIDARSEDEYHGRMNVHTRNGHIPTAVHLDWQDNIEDLFNPLFRPPETLRKRYTDAGSDTASQIITYCRTGSRSSHTYFTLRMLGYTNVRNYSGSWMEWSEDPSLPVETG
ncbi:MAG: sulfurtransferase [Spirochaetota bacterium]